ncbi:MAG TPA: hypothetical protein VKZ69_03910 [Limnochordales bacterium]|nr:hypothetical protein [Limnochordales bacterium]
MTAPRPGRLGPLLALALILALAASGGMVHGATPTCAPAAVPALPDAVRSQAEALLQAADEARWLQPVYYRELHMQFLRHGVETVARAIAWRPPAELRVEEDHDDGRRVAVWNGQERWLYDSRAPYVLHTPAEAPDRHLVARPLGAGPWPHPQRWKAVQWEWSEVQGPGGRPAYLVEGGKPYAYSRYWIDREHYFPWKEEHYGPGCQLVGVIVRSDVEFDPAFPPEAFHFEPPPGTQVVRDPVTWRVRSILHALAPHVPMPPAVPAYVPPGYRLTGGGITEVDGNPALHLRFYDGEDLLSVFQVLHDQASALAGMVRRVSDGRGAEVLVMGAVREGYLFLVVGDVSQAEAERILANLEFAVEP